MKKNKVLILGGSGMLGHMIAFYFKQNSDFDISIFLRKKSDKLKEINQIMGNALDINSLLNSCYKYDFVINCIGVLNKESNSNKMNSVFINSFLPLFLSNKLKEKKIKFIHISTDCVFDGLKGQYKVDDELSSKSIYGITKFLGETNDDFNLTIRTSIIGPDLNENGIGLFNWFIKQKNKNIDGYTNWFWSGVTTLELAKFILFIINNKKDFFGLINFSRKEKISKFNLLEIFNKEFGENLNISISKEKNYFNDKSLVPNTNFYEIPTYEKMIADMKEWIISNKHIYYFYREFLWKN